MPGRKPISAKLLTTEVTHYSNEELENRIDEEPIYNSQIFAVPEELDKDEAKKWNEIVALIRAIENHPLSDAHKDKMVQYCQVWVRRSVLIPMNKKDPLNKDIANLLAKYDMILRGINTELCLDLVSQAKIGKARNDYKKKKSDPVGDIRNREGK